LSGIATLPRNIVIDVLKYYSNPQQPQAFYSNGRQYYLGVRLSL
jgi:hypothetical protein